MWERRKRKPPKPAEAPPAIWITAPLLDRTAQVLQESGERGRAHEGVAYWCGRRACGECFVTTCIAPAAKTTYGSFTTSSKTNAAVIRYLASVGLELIGQVHSHPGALVGHSDGDDERALMPYEGFLSIVVPHYARHGMRPLTVCGIHIYEGAGFRRMSPDEIERRFHVVDELADLRT